MWHPLNGIRGSVRGLGTSSHFRTLEFNWPSSPLASGSVVPGAKYPVRVRVDDPKSGRPMAGVPVEIELTIETNGDDDIVAKRKVVTNSVGYVSFASAPIIRNSNSALRVF